MYNIENPLSYFHRGAREFPKAVLKQFQSNFNLKKFEENVINSYFPAAYFYYESPRGPSILMKCKSTPLGETQFRKGLREFPEIWKSTPIEDYIVAVSYFSI